MVLRQGSRRAARRRGRARRPTGGRRRSRRGSTGHSLSTRVDPGRLAAERARRARRRVAAQRLEVEEAERDLEPVERLDLAPHEGVEPRRAVGRRGRVGRRGHLRLEQVAGRQRHPAAQPGRRVAEAQEPRVERPEPDGRPRRERVREPEPVDGSAGTPGRQRRPRPYARVGPRQPGLGAGRRVSRRRPPAPRPSIARQLAGVRRAVVRVAVVHQDVGVLAPARPPR